MNITCLLQDRELEARIRSLMRSQIPSIASSRGMLYSARPFPIDHAQPARVHRSSDKDLRIDLRINKTARAKRGTEQDPTTFVCFLFLAVFYRQLLQSLLFFRQ